MCFPNMMMFPNYEEIINTSQFDDKQKLKQIIDQDKQLLNNIIDNEMQNTYHRKLKS